MTDETPDTPSTTPPDEIVARAAAFKTKVEDLYRMLGEVTDQYEREARFWEAETLLDLTRSAVETLWHYLHHPEETEQPDAYTEGPLGRRVPTHETPTLEGPSWDAPEVELQYPVDLKWEDETIVLATFTDTELGDDPEKWTEAGTKAAWNHRNIYVLDLITRGGRIRSDGTTLESLLPPDLVERFPALAVAERTTKTTASWEQAEAVPDLVTEHVEAARAALQARYRPFLLTITSLASVSHEWVLQAGEFYPPVMPPDLAGLTIRDAWARLSFENRRRFQWDVLDRTLAAAHAEANVENLPDLLQVKGHVQGTPFTATLRVAFHPLVLDTREPRRAFYPVTLSVIYAGDLPLAEWPEETRQKLWDAFLATLDRGLDVVRKSVAAPPPSPSPSPEPPPPSPSFEYAGPPPVARKVFPLAFGLTKVDADVLELVGSVHKVRFPASRWSSLKSWPELVQEEIDTILEKEGEAAFSPIKNGRAPLLQRRLTRTGETVTRLSQEAEHRLKIQRGLSSNGYRYIDPMNGKEYLSRVFEFRSGHLEVGLSWFGLAGPWVDEWRKGVQKEARDREKQTSLFDELDDEARSRINRARLLDDSHRLMEAVLGQVGKQRQNPVIVSAEAFRVLLGLRDDPHWKARLEGGLDALRACEFRFRSFDTGQLLKGYGAFLSGWQYRGAGPGAHGDGAYLLYIHGPFLGCLTIFEKDTRKIGGEHVTTFDFTKQLSEEDKAKVGWGYDRKTRARRVAVARFVEFDAGRPFYSAAAGLTPTQEALHKFIDAELTRRGSTVSKVLGSYATRKTEQVPRQAHDASLPRTYGSSFCPLLPEGRRYFAALGNFARNPEHGWTLYGTARRESKTGGAHVPGLLNRMSYTLPVGRGSRALARADVVKKALQDIQAVVSEYFEGVVAAYHEGRWLTLEDAAKLPDEDLGRRTRWFFFVPETYRTDRREKWEKTTGYTVTEDPAEAQRATFRELGDALALRERLRAARIDRGLSQAAVGALFGVSQRTVGFWEIGPEPHEDGKVRGKPIPVELVPFLERWLSGGPPPTVEELEGRKATRTGVRKPPVEPPADENR